MGSKYRKSLATPKFESMSFLNGLKISKILSKSKFEAWQHQEMYLMLVFVSHLTDLQIALFKLADVTPTSCSRKSLMIWSMPCFFANLWHSSVFLNSTPVAQRCGYFLNINRSLIFASQCLPRGGHIAVLMPCCALCLSQSASALTASAIDSKGVKPTPSRCWLASCLIHS